VQEHLTRPVDRQEVHRAVPPPVRVHQVPRRLADHAVLLVDDIEQLVQILGHAGTVAERHRQLKLQIAASR
jgi:hypothetical protein